jgi:antitoxin component of MazEF toxin-antitoxin module
MTETIKVTVQGVLVPRPMIQAWGDVQEVEIEQHSDAIIIKPKGRPATELRERIVTEMKAAGLVEDLSWTSPPVVPAEERARLAKAMSQGKPLSEVIIEEREDRA